MSFCKTLLHFRSVILFFCIAQGMCCHAQTIVNPDSIDHSILNNLILKEVNAYRKKAKVAPVVNESALSAAADDHAGYMLEKQKLTHYQRIRIKKTPKNRVDFYGEQFDRVGENVQLNNLNLNSSLKDKKRPRIDTYEKLAEALVLAWKKSPPHYANMINPDFITTYTSVAIGENGEIYACQLFGGALYKDKYKKERDTIVFKPDRPWRCWRCKLRPPTGIIEVTEDSMIIFKSSPPKIFGIVIPPVFRTRMRLFNPWTDGLAADIIVKSQYTCDSNSYHNGLSNFRGIPLEPVYKKDYMGIPYGRTTQIVLGKVPDYIDEEFEVNLVVIQNKRPCSNTAFNVIPSEFHVEIPLSFGFEPAEAILKCFTMDSLLRRMYFDKSMISPKDSVLPEIITWLEKNRHLLKSVAISGHASIEGTTENNTELYKNRTNYLLRILDSLGIDASLIQVESTENFKDFRQDIIGTEYEYLNKLSDTELKEKLADRALSAELEFILKNHRYVSFKAITRFDYEIEYHKNLVNDHLFEYMKEKDLENSVKMQRIQFGLALSDKMTWAEIDSLGIPLEKRFLKLLHNKAVMKFMLDTINLESLKAFRAELWQLRLLKEEDKRLNTSIAIVDYYLYLWGQYFHEEVSFYDSIRKWKNIDEVQQARILLNVASSHDWDVWRSTGSYNEKKYWYKKVKPYVEPARLDADKTFEIATYYSFFWQHDYAYQLTKVKIDETESPHDLVFFLKLIHLTDVDLPRKTYLKYFRKIKEYAGPEFCTFFNSPALNFQIFDDPEIKEIYCQECSGM